ncbi:hypothetical protein E3N88_13562 [Mikania micrantha]|uniref:Uncharacterized protein n=1 Tax=Mikania micrantha TaxID=192012 RepID=A0A5N6P948_9ASTR|nr:hypothetical protein E3N88_13562 [Mikania micrantha]
MGSLYLVHVLSGEVTNPVKTNAKVGLVDSRVKRVQFTAKNSGTPGNQLEHIRRSECRRDFHDSGSIESVRTQLGNQCWVQKTGKPNEISPGKLLLVGSVPLRIPASDGSSLWESAGIEDEKTWSVMTRLGPSEVSGPFSYWMKGLLCALDGGLDSIARPPSGRLLGLRRPLGD